MPRMLVCAVVGKHTFINKKNELEYVNIKVNKINTNANIKVRHTTYKQIEEAWREMQEGQPEYEIK